MPQHDDNHNHNHNDDRSIDKALAADSAQRCARDTTPLRQQYWLRCVFFLSFRAFNFFFHNALVCLRFFLLLLFQAWRRCESNAHFRATLTKLQKNKNDCCSHHSLSLPRPPISFLHYFYANISAVTCGHAWLSRARSVAAQCDAD